MEGNAKNNIRKAPFPPPSEGDGMAAASQALQGLEKEMQAKSSFPVITPGSQSQQQQSPSLIIVLNLSLQLAWHIRPLCT